MTDKTSAGSSKNRVHELKTWPEFFARIEDGTKTFELRKDDRGFRVGDTLVLREWNPRMETYTGNELRRVVTYLMCGPPFGLMKDWVAMGLAPETFVIPVSPHMPKRERPAKAPSKSGLRYQQELAHYCGFRWQWLNLPPSEQLETLLEQLADAKDDALRLHHAYVDLKFPEMARPELKANALQPIPATEDDISHWWKCLNCHARNDPETYPVSCPCCATLRPTQNGGAERG